MVAKTLVLLNNAAGRGRARHKLEAARALAEAAGVEVAGADTPQELEARASEAARGGVARVIAAGGDGTAHLVLNGVVGTEAAFGIIPCGSGNDLAVGLGIPGNIEAAARLAFSGPVRSVDVARLTPAGPNPTARYFGCIASFGLDSHANRIANQHTGFWTGTSLYVYALLRTLLEYQPPEVTITHDGGQYQDVIMLAVAANAPSYGGGMRIAPRAEMADGQLDVCVLSRMSRLRLLWNFPKVFRGTHLALKEITYLRSARVRVEGSRPLEIFADGEFVGYTPAEVEVLPGKLKVIAP